MEPNFDRVGEKGVWTLDDADGIVEVEGDLIGFVSTREASHEHHERWAPKGTRCRGCRWFEVSIIQTETKYVMYRIGKSQVPRETPMYTPLTVTKAAGEMIDEAHHWNQKTGARFLSSPAEECLRMAAEYDDEMDAAWKEFQAAAKQVVRRIS